MRVDWRPMARQDRRNIMEYIAEDNVAAALELDEEIQAKVYEACRFPRMYRAGRMPGTREIVVRDNYVVVYRIAGDVLVVGRVIHAAQRWPPQENNGHDDSA